MREVFRDERVVLFAAEEVFIARWVEAPTMVQMEAMRRVSRPHEASVSGGCGLFNIVVSGQANFTPEFRAHAAKVSADPDRFRRFRAHVILLEGLRGLTVKLFVNTFALLTRPPVATAAFREAGSAAHWALPLLADGGWSEKRLEQLLSDAIKPR